jgi:hypothetical protein
MDVVWLFGIVVVAILAYCGVDLASEKGSGYEAPRFI